MKFINKIARFAWQNFLAPKFYSLRDKNILIKNSVLNNKFIGKRCFVIGSGPSVSSIDLSKLSGEYTFVCAEFDKQPQYKPLRPKFHILSDSAYFTKGESQYWNEQFIKKDASIDCNTTELFVNLGAKSFVEKHNIFKKHKLNYIGTQGIINDWLPLNLDLTKYLPWPKNSILLCLIIASYLGFREIYLLGVEHNFLSYNIGLGKAAGYNHSYEDEISKVDLSNDEVTKKLIVPREHYMTYEDNIAHIYQLFKNYRFFWKKAQKIYPGIKIYNTTPESFLDVFPKKDLSNVI